MSDVSAEAVEAEAAVEDVPAEAEAAPVESVFVRGSGGSIFEMDIPSEASALERFDAAVERGELVILDPDTVVKVDVDGGGYTWADVPRDDAPVPAPPEPEALDEDDDSVDSDGDGTADKAELLTEAEKLGVTVDKRWGIARIAAAIEAAND
jgi:hypothetical protein